MPRFQRLKLQIYQVRRPELLSCVPLIPLKLPVRFSPGGLEKNPISWGFLLGIFILDMLLHLFYISLVLKQVLIFHMYRKEVDKGNQCEEISSLCSAGKE